MTFSATGFRLSSMKNLSDSQPEVKKIHSTPGGIANVIAWHLNGNGFDGPAKLDPQAMASGAVDVQFTDPFGKVFIIRISEK